MSSLSYFIGVHYRYNGSTSAHIPSQALQTVPVRVRITMSTSGAVLLPDGRSGRACDACRDKKVKYVVLHRVLIDWHSSPTCFLFRCINSQDIHTACERCHKHGAPCLYVKTAPVDPRSISKRRRIQKDTASSGDVGFRRPEHEDLEPRLLGTLLSFSVIKTASKSVYL